MSKMGQYVLEMQEDALCMTVVEFCNKHGKSAAEVYWKYRREEEDIDLVVVRVID